MNIYRISQDVNNGPDTFGSAVVVAHDEEHARLIHPSGKMALWLPDGPALDEWCEPRDVKVELIGTADNKYIHGTVICASFNAG